MRSGARDFVDWLLIKDIVALTWEIQRARRLSQSLTSLYQSQALADILQQLLPKPALHSPARDEHIKLVEQWSNGQEAAVKRVDALFARAGFGMSEVDAQALTEHAEEFDRIEARSARCEERKDKLLQQIERRLSGSAKSVLDASQGVIEAHFVSTPPKGASENGGATA